MLMNESLSELKKKKKKEKKSLSTMTYVVSFGMYKREYTWF